MALTERVLYLPAGKRQSKWHDRWLEGLFLGVCDDSDEVLVGTPEGVFRVRSFRRLTAADRRDPVMLASVRGTPWCPVPGANGGAVPAARLKVSADAVVPEAVCRNR